MVYPSNGCLRWWSIYIFSILKNFFMNKELKKIIVSLLILFIGFIIIDNATAVIGQSLLSKIPNEGQKYTKINYIINRLNSDVVIIGSSEASHHYIPSVIKHTVDSIYNSDCTVYNAGIDGHYFNYQSCWIECILKRYSPKIIIWDLSDVALMKSDEGYNSIYPYYNCNKVVERYVNEEEMPELLKILSKQYQYNSKFLGYIKDIVFPQGFTDGYIPLYGKMSKKTADMKNNEGIKDFVDYDSLSITRFRKILKLCNAKKIKLIIASSPRFAKSLGNNFLYSECKINNIHFFDKKNTPYFNHRPELFQDGAHLNDEGAKIFSEMFCSDLKLNLKK